MITSEQFLTHYDPRLPLRLACDASPVGIGAVLSHVMSDGTERPIAFASRTLRKTEQKYAQIDKEALSIVWGVKKFHVYLFGRLFTLYTDHQPLTSIFHPRKSIPVVTAARLQRFGDVLAVVFHIQKMLAETISQTFVLFRRCKAGYRRCTVCSR